MSEALDVRDGPFEETMPIDATTFGAITINGKTYDHDVIIRLSGAVGPSPRKARGFSVEEHRITS
jgi:hypothetical protein